MHKWKNFELSCTDYLNKTFGKHAKFIHQGGSDSTVPDILVKTNTGNSFYIEAKYSPAQCGQFVLLPNIKDNVFEYSVRKDTSINCYSDIIKQYMDKYFNEFRNAGTKGKDIVFKNSSKIFSKWIIQNYKEKCVKYIITNDYVLFPIEEFFTFFEVSAKYRIKRSGSSDVGKQFIYIFDKILKNDITLKSKISNIRIQNNKLFVNSSFDLHNKRFIYNDFEYMFSRRGSEFEIRKLSNTYNANVIFSIKLRNSRLGIDNNEFISILNM